jgi:catechol 2,3-dioxygenase-like lactoylglutathione lyase family enzyme
MKPVDRLSAPSNGSGSGSGEGTARHAVEPGGAVVQAGSMHLALATLLVHDYDEGIAWFVEVLGFRLVEDTDLGHGKRWVVVSPSADGGTGLLLARAADDDQSARIGNQTGGRVGFFLHSDDFQADHARMAAAGAQFLEEPRREPYGTVAVFLDCSGNRWDLVQHGG